MPPRNMMCCAVSGQGAGVAAAVSLFFSLARFDRSFWYILWLSVLFASVFFPFRSTFAIEFFQDSRHLTLAEAGTVNGWVFFSAILATPVFGLLADRIGKRALLLTVGATDAGLWISTALMGISFSVIPAVIWPATAMLGLFFGLSVIALPSTWALWRRERGPDGHGLENLAEVK